MTCACDIRVRGVVQGVGFRPFVFRLAHANTLAGWVLNDGDGVEIHLEGAETALQSFVHSLRQEQPPAACITAIDVRDATPAGVRDFTIRESRLNGAPTAGISPDLPVCEQCLQEMFDASNPRAGYPYINCTSCGPRYSVILSLPYDRAGTTMRAWPLDALCAAQYHDPANRRFHAQPVACPACGPGFKLKSATETIFGSEAAIRKAAALLSSGAIVAVKGLGGYHLACDARNRDTVEALRRRKFRKDKPFALMVKNLEQARAIAGFSAAAEALLNSDARPIVVAPAAQTFEGVSPDNDDLGVMLAYAPLHHLLFEYGAPEVLVMTSANRSNEPIAYRDEDALEQLAGIADIFLIGERPIARRVEDSIARDGIFGPVILRRSRGYAPASVAAIPVSHPILATGADLKNTITLVVNGQATLSQHIGDLDQYAALESFRETIRDLTSMYGVQSDQLTIAHDLHPQYRSSLHAMELGGARICAVQHHRAHIASVLAEREAWDKRVLGISFDGTGYGDDGTIWGGEIFAGSIVEGFTRVAHLRPASLPGGDSCARYPLQAAAGFLTDLCELPEMFESSDRFKMAAELIRKNVRTFATTSVGRLFDAAAALLGFTRESTFEGQAAMWLEHLAKSAPMSDPYPFPFSDGELDYRPLLISLAADRRRGRARPECALAFHRGVAQGVFAVMAILMEKFELDTVVLSGGVFQNQLLLRDIRLLTDVEIWTNQKVPPNDGGISLGQAALAAFTH